jgi:hypothetical protein
MTLTLLSASLPHWSDPRHEQKTSHVFYKRILQCLCTALRHLLCTSSSSSPSHVSPRASSASLLYADENSSGVKENQNEVIGGGMDVENKMEALEIMEETKRMDGKTALKEVLRRERDVLERVACAEFRRVCRL